jgi:hypothetical protein
MMKRRERGGLLGLFLVAASVPAVASTVVVEGTDIAYQNPSSSGDGSTIALERVLYEDGPTCAKVAFTDVAVYRPRSGCGSKVLTQITRDGRSSDPSASADGNWIAWRTKEATTTHFFVARNDGSDRDEVFTCNGGNVADLEISPLGDYIVFRAFGCNGATQEQIIRVAVSSPFVADVVDAGRYAGELGLNRHRCMGPLGVVYYSKQEPYPSNELPNGLHHLYRQAPGSSIQTLVATADDERNISTDCLMGLTALFRRTTSGVDNLFAVSTTGVVRQLTSNTLASWEIGPATIARDGYSFVMESHGDFTDGNADLGLEVFFGTFDDTHPAALTQVTDVPEPPPFTPPILHAIAGSTLADPGCLVLTSDAVFFSSIVVNFASPCRPEDLNQLALTQYPLRSPVVATSANDFEVVPSFDLVLDPATDPLTGCTFDPIQDWIRLCTMRITTAADSARRVLVHDTWDIVDCHQVHGAVEIDVPAKSTRYVTLRLDGCSVRTRPGTVTIDVTSPDLGQADVHRVAWTYP